ncbi:MAG: 50S ribosomal protein L9 [Clostridia bacterium]|nr:50S ribosomal protein L9 [Clostridia bacterium]MBQ7788601.1 50S ribosomal protein L9 [Clostridia bacterium]
MKVVLLQDVKAQGKKNQIVEVSEGYARNFLFPKKLAVIADAKAINDVKNKEDSKNHKLALERADAKALSEKISACNVKITADAGNDGRFYGAVTAKDISEALKSQFGIDVDKRKIVLDAPIKAFGTYKLDVKVYTEISAKLTVMVTEK